MRRVILWTALVLVLSAGTLVSTAEAAKPALVVESVSLTDTGSCVATLAWSGLKGGKQLEIRTRLANSDGTSVVGATQTYWVRQGEGALVIDYATLPFGTDTSLTFEATFVMRDGDVFVSAAGTCVP